MAISAYSDPGPLQDRYSGFSQVMSFGSAAYGDFGVYRNKVTKDGSHMVIAEWVGKKQKKYPTFDAARDRATELNTEHQTSEFKARRA